MKKINFIKKFETLHQGFYILVSFFISCAVSADQNNLDKLTMTSWASLLGSDYSKKNGKVKKLEDGKNFYLSSGPASKEWLLEELSLAIKQLQNENRAENFICKFPARSLWIHEKFPNLVPGFDKTFQLCPLVKNWLAKTENQEISLFFAVADHDEPASMFGHTFLGFHEKENRFISGLYVNYAAHFSNEDTGLKYFYRGVFGGYTGKIFTGPLLEKINEYRLGSSRDIISYKINFTPAEKRLLSLAIYESKRSNYQYFFFTENCSYFLSRLIKIIRPNINSSHSLFGEVIPSNFVRALEDAEVVNNYQILYSAQKSIERSLHESPKFNSQHFIDSIDSSESITDWLIKNSFEHKVLALSLLNMKIKRDSLPRDKAQKARIILQRNLLQKGTFSLAEPKSHLEHKLKITKENDLTSSMGHLPSRLRLGFQSSHSTSFFTGEYRHAYHDFQDSSSRARSLAELSGLELKFSSNEEKIIIEEITLANVKSLPRSNRLFFKPAKEFMLSFQRNDFFSNTLSPQLKIGRGLAFGPSESFLFYNFISAHIISTDSSISSLRGGLSHEVGLLSSSPLGTANMRIETINLQGSSSLTTDTYLEFTKNISNNYSVYLNFNQLRKSKGPAINAANIGISIYF